MDLEKLLKMFRPFSLAFLCVVVIGLVLLSSKVAKQFYLYELVGVSLSLCVTVYGISGMIRST
jgi:hypothetical protein